MKRCLAAMIAALLVGGCGHTSPPKVSTPVHPCDPANYTMQCSLAGVPAAALSAPSLTLSRPVAQGIDFAWACPSSSGYAFGASYLSTDPSKNWTHACVERYVRVGAHVVFVWETSEKRAFDGCGAGAVDARSAWSQGAPLGARVIYFAVDTELQPSEYSAVRSYFRCASQTLGVTRTGAYGGIATIRVLFDAHLIHYGWQTYAWSGGRWERRAQIEQYLNGASFDHDRAVAVDYGQTPGPHVVRHSISAEERHLHLLIRIELPKVRQHIFHSKCGGRHYRKACRPLRKHGAAVKREIAVLHRRGVK